MIACLVSEQAAYSLGDSSLHLSVGVPQPTVFLAQVLILLHQGGAASSQLLLIDFGHGQLAQRFTQMPPDFLWVLLKGFQQVLVGGVK